MGVREGGRKEVQRPREAHNSSGNYYFSNYSKSATCWKCCFPRFRLRFPRPSSFLLSLFTLVLSYLHYYDDYYSCYCYHYTSRSTFFKNVWTKPHICMYTQALNIFPNTNFFFLLWQLGIATCNRSTSLNAYEYTNTKETRILIHPCTSAILVSIIDRFNSHKTISGRVQLSRLS